MSSQELEELNNKLVMATMSSVSHEKKFHNSTIKEQNIKQLHQKFNMVLRNMETFISLLKLGSNVFTLKVTLCRAQEYEMNRKLHDENESLQAEKQVSIKNTVHILLPQCFFLYHFCPCISLLVRIFISPVWMNCYSFDLANQILEYFQFLSTCVKHFLN